MSLLRRNRRDDIAESSTRARPGPIDVDGGWPQYAAGHLRLTEYYASGDLTALQEALQLLSSCVEHAASVEGDRPSFETALGWALMSAHDAVGDPALRDAAIDHFTTAIELPVGEREAKVSAVAGLAGGMISRDDPGDLERGVGLLERGFADSLDSAERRLLVIGLGMALVELHRRTRDSRCLTSAITHLSDVVGETSDDRSASMRATLAHVLLYRFDEEGRRDDLVRAAALYESVVTCFEPGSPQGLQTSSELMMTLTKLAGLTCDDRLLDRAIEIGERAVEGTAPGSRSQRDLALRLAAAINNRFCVHDAARLQEAIRIVEDSLVADGGADRGAADVQALVLLAACHRNIYTLTQDRQQLELACASVEDALARLRQSFGLLAPLHALEDDREYWSVYPLAGDCYLERAGVDVAHGAELLTRAMVIAETGKGRLLTEQIGRGDLPPPPSVPAAVAAHERELVVGLVASDRAELAGSAAYALPTAEAQRVSAAHRADLRQLWSQIERLGPDAAAWVRMRRADPPTWEELRSLATAGTVVVSLAELGNGLVAYVVPHGAAAPSLVRSGLDDAALVRIVEALRRETSTRGANRRETWHERLVPFFTEVGRHVAGAARVVIAPQSLSHLIPWSVVALRSGWWAAEQPAIPLLTVPALGVAPALRQAGSRHVSTEAIVVGNPTGDLPAAAREATAVAEQLGVEPLLGQAATRDHVLEHLATARIVHLATHARFQPRSPLDSGIVLADGVITAEDLLAHQLSAELVVLSACESGLVDSLGGNEVAGLGQTLLLAGARTVVMSLWSVDDDSTAELMTRLHDERAHGAGTAAALAAAATAVRSQTRWHSAAHWGAFVVLGGLDEPTGRSV